MIFLEHITLLDWAPFKTQLTVPDASHSKQQDTLVLQFFDLRLECQLIVEAQTMAMCKFSVIEV